MGTKLPQQVYLDLIPGNETMSIYTFVEVVASTHSFRQESSLEYTSQDRLLQSHPTLLELT